LRVTGECCICGYIGELTFEHVPPRAAYNDRRVFEAKMENLLGGEWIPGTAVTNGRYLRRGAGRYSLCGKCNNDTGAWYGTPYVDFGPGGARVCSGSNPSPRYRIADSPSNGYPISI
jgi:5-methylcytosine-specific restriction endonuclease McrA